MQRSVHVVDWRTAGTAMDAETLGGISARPDIGNSVTWDPDAFMEGFEVPGAVVYATTDSTRTVQQRSTAQKLVFTCIMHDRTTTLPGHHTEFSTSDRLQCVSYENSSWG